MKRKRFLRLLRLVWLTAGLLFMIWLFQSFQARGFSEAILRSNGSVAVHEAPTHLSFMPTESVKNTGLLFYPGAMVDPHAYAPLAQALAQQGTPVIIVKLPWRLALLPDQETAVFAQTLHLMAANPDITHWVLGGHSRGGALATRFAHTYAQQINGLALIGTSHPKEGKWDLSGYDLPVIKVYATNDGLASVAEVEANRIYLPPTTQMIAIQGGNHAQFGWYGTQLGDGQATIDRATQQGLLLDALLQILAYEAETG